MFHVLQSGGLTYLCMSTDAAGRRLPFAYLDDVQGRFAAQYGGAAATALAYAFNDEFARVLAQQMDHFNSSTSVDNLGRVRGEIAEVKSIMIENIEKVRARACTRRRRWHAHGVGVGAGALERVRVLSRDSQGSLTPKSWRRAVLLVRCRSIPHAPRRCSIAVTRSSCWWTRPTRCRVRHSDSR